MFDVKFLTCVAGFDNIAVYLNELIRRVMILRASW